MKSVLLIISILSSLSLYGQNEVQWTFSYNSASNSVEAEAVIAEGWHLYSQFVNNEIGIMFMELEKYDSAAVYFQYSPG